MFGVDSGQSFSDTTRHFVAGAIDLAMNSLLKCQQQSSVLEKNIEESKSKWQAFVKAQDGYQSMLRCEGKSLPPPVVR